MISHVIRCSYKNWTWGERAVGYLIFSRTKAVFKWALWAGWMAPWTWVTSPWSASPHIWCILICQKPKYYLLSSMLCFLIGNMSALLFFFYSHEVAVPALINKWFAYGRSIESDSESEPSWHHFSLWAVSLWWKHCAHWLESSAWGQMAGAAAPHLQNFSQKLNKYGSITRFWDNKEITDPSSLQI